MVNHPSSKKVSLEALKAGLKSILDEVKVDEKWRFFLNGVRYVFVPQSMMMLVFEEILNVLGATVKTMLWPFIDISGYTVANQLMDRGAPPEKVIEAYADFNDPRGWGLTEAVKTDLEKPEVVVRMHNSYFASWLRENVKDLTAKFPFYECPWGPNWIGAVRAAIERSGRQPPKLVYKEVKCLALGDDYCEWYIGGEEE
ncbi:MAG: hypothetical protein ACTSWP_02950 [Candidatus Freyarchaeota archaeon]|nr:hypothetical protein [Candidatus Freyrarchaeum guaymaensis]